MEYEIDGKPVKSGMVALVGPPNAGKSTLMNRLLNQKISIVTPKPQTTRNRILGIVSSEEYQIVLIDTPGIHQPREPLNREMVRIAMESLAGVDLVLFLIDVKLPLLHDNRREIKTEYREMMENIESPAILVLNKIDLLAREETLPMIERYAQIYPFATILPVSALKGDGMEKIIDEMIRYLPLGPKLYPDDMPTSASERFLCAEIIREKIFLQTGQEIPYSTAVIIDQFKEGTGKEKTLIHATIVLERSSQKSIVIGKGGKRLKSIGIEARKDIEEMIDRKVNLRLWVKVKKNWSKNESFLRNELKLI